MKTSEVNHVIRMRIKIIRNTLERKAVEYASKEDHLRSFKNAARRLGKEPEEVLWTWMEKHTECIDAFINKLAEEGREFDSRLYVIWDEKITDAINYLILLDALLLERFDYDFKTEMGKSKK